MRRKIAVVLLGVILGVGAAAEYPQKQLDNRQIKLTIDLPDPAKGYYKGTRFDWSGAIVSLEYQGHSYYSNWFEKTAPAVDDWEFQGGEIVAGPVDTITGPVEEFSDLGYNDAKPGGTFVKIGVGSLRKTGTSRYNQYHLYEIVDPGKWSVRSGADFVEFTQKLSDSSSGYSYVYRKVIRLVRGKPQFTMEHSLKNTGQRAIESRVYNHNFLRLDKEGPGPGIVITVPFQIQTARPPKKNLAEVSGNQIAINQLRGEDELVMQLRGFGDTPKDYDVRVENRKTGVGMRVTADRPLSSESLWSIRTVLSMEPYISMKIDPGNEFTWKLTYEYYTKAAQ
jgi:hypothetical protein